MAQPSGRTSSRSRIVFFLKNDFYPRLFMTGGGPEFQHGTCKDSLGGPGFTFDLSDGLLLSASGSPNESSRAPHGRSETTHPLVTRGLRVLVNTDV